MPMLSGSYDLAMRVLRWASPPFAGGSSKLARGIGGRTNALDVLGTWAGANRDESRPLVWTHAPSVGEGLQAKVVFEELLKERPSVQSVYTFFSPSAESFGEAFPAGVSGYLPWDIRSDLRELISVLAPGLLSFTNTEVWPGLTRVAVDEGIPVVLCAATLPRGSGRLRPGARSLLTPTFRALSKVLTIAAEDGERFTKLGVSPDRIQVTGDPAIDSAHRRAAGADPHATYLAPFHEDPRRTLVAGSTWPSDEAMLVPVLRELVDRFPGFRSIVAPHEPSAGYLDRLETVARAEGLSTIRLAEVEARGDAAGFDLVLVDRMGVLVHLYTVGSFAYVGGGFRRAGLHSVLEPAAAGAASLFGPRHGRSRAARDLIRLGGGQAVTTGPDLAAVLSGWLEDEERGSEIGAKARGYVDRHIGAAERTARAIAVYLPTEAVGNGVQV